VTALQEIGEYCDSYMRIGQIQDYENALNGVQVENSGTVKKIAAAVDVSTRALQEAAKCGANLLIVHHGMFWLGLRPVTTALPSTTEIRLRKRHCDLQRASSTRPASRGGKQRAGDACDWL
jgi:putative NIF3 family GTP cyclohydrolase 1 type 2